MRISMEEIAWEKYLEGRKLEKKIKKDKIRIFPVHKPKGRKYKRISEYVV